MCWERLLTALNRGVGESQKEPTLVKCHVELYTGVVIVSGISSFKNLFNLQVVISLMVTVKNNSGTNTAAKIGRVTCATC